MFLIVYKGLWFPFVVFVAALLADVARGIIGDAATAIAQGAYLTAINLIALAERACNYGSKRFGTELEAAAA